MKVAKKPERRMLMASDGTNFSASADISATSQQVDSNNMTTSFPVFHVDQDKLQNAKADAGDHIAGYIFMCNAGTKPDCFIYRVFGLPASRMGVVQKIKPNTKLFLFDFDVKLLYGLYVADTSGIWELEPYAFGGRFPAQVRFSIVRDCLPLPEVFFKDVIKENYYSGSKFKQELSDEQVNKLVSLFCPIKVPLPQQPSPGFSDALRSFCQKYMEPSHQVTRYTYMHNERSVQEVPQVASASRYYGQNPMHQSTMTPVSPVVAPSSSMVSSSSRVSQLVAVAAQALKAEDQISNFMPPSSNEPGLNNAHLSYNCSNIRGVGYGYQDLVKPSSQQALSVSNRAMHTHDMHPYSVSSSYQNQGDAILPRVLVSGSNVVSVDSTSLNYDSRNHPASLSYGYAHNQGDPAFPQMGPSVSADNSNLYYNGTNSGNLVYGRGNQGYYSCHQAAVDTSVQLSSNVSQVHQPYWPTAPSGYVNQDSNDTQVHQPYWPAAPSGYMNYKL